MIVENLILHPDLLADFVSDHAFSLKFNQLKNKAEDRRVRLWVSSASLIEVSRRISDKKFRDNLECLLNNVNILALLEKDVFVLLQEGWDGYLNLLASRLANCYILVNELKGGLKREVSLELFLNMQIHPSLSFIDLEKQQDLIRSELEDRFYKILYSCKFILGNEIDELEQKLKEFVGTKFCVTVSSGTDALLSSLLAYGIGPGDAVFTTPFTFVATAEVISLLGAVPIFVDIEEHTFNIDPFKLEQAIKSFISNDTIYPLPRGLNLSGVVPKGIIAVDLFGVPADYGKINEIAREYKMFVIEDAAQSFGAEYMGERACSLADVGCTSFFPAKPLGAYGDGGAVFLNDEGLYHRIRSIRVHGQGKNRYEHIYTGINGRFDTLQAAVIIAKLKYFPDELKLRQKVADYYSSALKEISEIRIPCVSEDRVSCWAQYSILLKDESIRDTLIEGFKKRGVPYAIYYPIPLHLQPAFAYLGYKKGDFPVSEMCSKRILSLPIYPYMKRWEQDLVLETIFDSLN